MMSSENRPAQSILWIGKRPASGGTPGGDEVYDRRTTDILAKRYNLERYFIAAQKRPIQAAALLQGIPHPRYKYYSRSIIQDIQRRADDFDHVVVSWESFDFLPQHLDRPVSLVLHNVMSDTIAEIFKGQTIPALASLQSRAWEKRMYAATNARLVVLSQRDADIARQLVPGVQVHLASPGCPPPAELDKSVFIPEVVISGSYDWYPKRRDLLAFGRDVQENGSDFCFRYDHPFPNVRKLHALSDLSSNIGPEEFRNGIRIGLIPDTFLGGFKLKATHYISMNCAIASMCDLRSEFNGIPHADEFVTLIASLADLQALISTYRRKADLGWCNRWQEFKAACENKFSWEHTAKGIESSLD